MAMSNTLSDCIDASIGDAFAAIDLKAILNGTAAATTFNGVTLPVAGAAQGAAASALTDNTGGAVTTTLAAGITDTVAKNAIASLAAQVNALTTLVGAIRTALISENLIKGSA